MFPNVILESMSYGNPFVGTNTTGVPEAAENGEGLLGITVLEPPT